MDGDASLRDQQLQDEIELVGELVLAASQAEGPLGQDRIDAILGVPSPADGTSADGTPATAPGVDGKDGTTGA